MTALVKARGDINYTTRTNTNTHFKTRHPALTALIDAVVPAFTPDEHPLPH